MGLTVKRIEKLTQPGRYKDDERGLYLQVRNADARSWVFRYERRGKERLMGLGSLQDFTLEEARAKARKARQQIADGIDPLDQQEAERAARKSAEAEARAIAVTFEEAARQCFAHRQAQWKNDKHRAQFLSTLVEYAFPVIGSMVVGKVARSHILEILQKDNFWNQKTETASRVRQRIEMVLNYSTVQEWRRGENPARWKGNIDQVLLPKASIKPVKNHTALPLEEIGSFMIDLRLRKAPAARALEFLILTATRTNEVIGALRTEIDWDQKIWTIPVERMKIKKFGKPHRVPLSDAAIAMLQELDEVAGNPYLFPGQGNNPLSNMAMLQLLQKRMGLEITAHGFRSTFKDWAREETKHAREVAEAALAHVLESDTEAAYARGDLLEKRRVMMADWADFCSRPFVKPSGNVVAFRAAAE